MRKIKKLSIASIVVALTIGSVAAAEAAPTTKVMFTAATGAPLPGNTLPSLTAGDVVTMVIGSFPTGKGMYVYHQSCGIQVELDSISSAGDTSEDQFFPFTYVVGTSASKETTNPAASSVSVTASINDTALEQNKASVTLAYRTPLTVVTSASDGSKTTMNFTADPSGKTLCVVDGKTIKAVTAVGTCNLEVHAGTAVGYYPFYLGKGVQTVKQKVTSAKRGKPKSLTLKSNFGETVSYKVTSKKICTTVDNTLIGLTPGKCTITAAALGTTNYDQFSANIVVTITK